MNLVLLRHATRSSMLEFGATESMLNVTGLAQAEDLIQHVQPHGPLPAPTHLLSSPKIRAQQTLKPLSKALDLEVQIVNNLDERRERESLANFERRVRDLAIIVESFKENDSIYLCTHLDVLEAAALLWPTDFSERESAQTWSTLEYQVFRLKNGLLEATRRGRVEPRG